MKIVLEKIIPSDKDSSFSWLINPKLNDFYFWHFHPEYELVFIEAAKGRRQVGDHIGTFLHSDLVLIGSNIPHLNFDYGIKTEYTKTVLHIHPTFLEKENQTKELKPIIDLLQKSKYGIVFGERIKKKVKNIFISSFHQKPFDQFISVLQMFRLLADSGDYKLLHKKEPSNIYNKKEKERIALVNDFIYKNYTRKISLQEVSDLVHLNSAAFCRYFKKMTKLSFVEFLNHYRINQAKQLLVQEHNVTEACFGCGFESLSYFNRTFKKITGENPLKYKKRME